MNTSFPATYSTHVATLCARAEAALASAERDELLIAAGMPVYRFEDDNAWPFAVNPQFKAWLPLTDAPGSWLRYRPGEKPQLIFVQPRDYWHVVPEAPQGYWTDAFEITIVRTPDAARPLLPERLDRCAVLGPRDCGLADVTPDNPPAVVNPLRWQRAFKTAWEIECMREANRIGARAHRAAERMFRRGESEFAIQLAYLAAARQTAAELPYDNIVALNRHGATLHYSSFDHEAPGRNRSFLIDAGASCNGYAADITRTYAAPAEEAFQALIDSVDAMQQDLAARVRADLPYPELHLRAHQAVAEILRTHGLIHMSADGAVESGLTRHFFPHGLGHGIGAQVHDIGGFMAGEDGGHVAPPDGHPYLRLTRTLAPGMAVTIEPGLYFIDLLLNELREKPAGKSVHWDRVEALHPCGGIRIEDDVVCTAAEPVNLTREAFAALD